MEAREWLAMQEMCMLTWLEPMEVCPECGCFDIEYMAWVRLRDLDVRDYDDGKGWCPNCQDDFKWTTTWSDFMEEFLNRKS